MLDERLRAVGAGVLVAVGLLNICGYVLGVPAFAAFARVTAASPLPVVFNDMGGLEPYAVDGELLLHGPGGARRYALGREWFASLRGPFIRRHAYLRLISEAPRKRRELWEPALRFAFCGRGPLAQEAGIEGPMDGFVLRLHSRSFGAPRTWDLAVACHR